MTLEERLAAAHVLGEVTILSVTPLCCCPNKGKPDEDGNVIVNAGCRVHGVKSNYGLRSKEPREATAQKSNGWHRAAE